MDVDGIVLDIDGVLVDDWHALPGAADAVERLRASGRPVTFLTNTTSRSRTEIATALRDAGIAVDDDEVTTAAVVTARHLAAHHPGARCLVFNEGGGTGDLGEVRLVDEDPEVVVIGSPGPGAFTWEQLCTALEAVHGGAALIGMHRNLKWSRAGSWLLDGGAYLAALEQASGVVATVIGKPSATVFREAAASLGTEPARTVMVGDSVDSDVLAAMAAGLRGVLVRTGGFRQEDLDAQDGRPDAVIDSIVDLPELFHATS